MDTTNTPQVSIIVPIYNTGSRFTRGLDSILAQTMTDFEVILVNDGSTDPLTNELCKAAPARDPRIRLIEQANGGVSVARNTGIDHARGTFIAFFDPDDILKPDIYAKLIDVMGDKTHTLVACGIQRMSGVQEIMFNRMGLTAEQVAGPYDAKLLQRDLFRVRDKHYVRGYIYCILFRRDELKARFTPGIYFCEDEVFLCDALNTINTFITIPEVLYTYDDNDAGACAKVRREGQNARMLRNWALRDRAKLHTFLHSFWRFRRPDIGLVTWFRFIYHTFKAAH